MKKIEEAVDALSECAQNIETIRELLKIAQETVDIECTFPTGEEKEDCKSEGTAIPKELLDQIKDLQEKLRPKE